MNLSVSGNVDDPETRVPLSSSGNKRPRVDEDQQDDSENEDTEERTDLDRFGFPRGVCQRVKVTAVNYSGVDLSLESPSVKGNGKRPRVDEDQQDDSDNEDTEERADLDRFGFPRNLFQRVKVTAVNFSGVDLSLESPSVKLNGVAPCPRTSVETFRDWQFRYRYQTGRGPSKAERYVKKDVGKTNVRDRCTGGAKAKADFAQHDEVVEPAKTETHATPHTKTVKSVLVGFILFEKRGRMKSLQKSCTA
eukprot:CAMPEP_0184672404 /NCGR_PEP_ID=MMETSP0308-20130426/86079_1 /TAXON_ID=38269 /ORGANISM="Gloeochaete witrockiana, Strain SAG 46.84" /LENGTH=248 /DNA_ID=CAMNT_0027119727 /DNA_START=109 /DNA_END=856 /DNA_ORIENTATION=+